MKKGYCLAILILLMISSMALAASESSTNRWSASGESTAFGSDQGRYANQMAQTSDQVTLTFYVLDGGPNGEPLPGVDVKVYDASGNSFEGVTDSRGPLIISGQPGPWKFTLAKEGYKTASMEYTITQSHKAFTYLQKSALVQVPAEAAAYSQITAPSTEPAQPQEPAALTIYVYESSLNGTALSDVDVTGQDAAGGSFEGTTDSNGAVVITGQPGTWQFTFTKEGYETLNLEYNVTETEEAAAYLQRAAQSAEPAQQPAEIQGPVDFAVYVHENTINGTGLSGVDVTGKDGAGNGFEGTTDSNGAVVITGQPGTWQFTFTKEGYGTLNLEYNVTETDNGDVYLQSADQLQLSQSEVPVVSEVAPLQTISTAS
jgi:phosphatidate phosphatase APP1